MTLPTVPALRHDLRTPVNHIVGYCEMLLEDTPAAAPQRRESLEAILAAVREALAAIDATLPPTLTVVGPDATGGLVRSLRGPHQRIVDATTRLLTLPDVTADPQCAADVAKIREAAERLVAVVGPPPAARPLPGGGGAATASLPATGRSRILIVDDVADNRDLLERRLRRQGHDVECAETGRQALDAVAQRPFDLVLLDVMMPDLDGYAVLEQLKAAPASRDIPVLMISALDELASIVRCIELGAEDYLPKPFDPVLLRARVNASLDKKRLRDQELDYLKQVAVVTEAASAVEQGQYVAGSLSAVARRDDALGRLARVFDAMVAHVHAREGRLQAQVRELRQEIAAARGEGGAGGPLDDARLAPGALFAERYEIRQFVGSGGMGAVYRAHDRVLDEDVAIKLLRPELRLNDPGMTERLKLETRLARRISHQNVVRTHDLGEWNGLQYVTMEYVEGLTVRALLDLRGKLGVPATLAIATQLADSLDVAHGHGVIHRDIKPQNLLLDADGVLKIMDFGIARLAERASGLTEVGAIVGTPAYMAPEQLLSEAVDARSDLYAVGVVLYECLTGRRPFEAPSTIALIAKLLKDEPVAPATLNPEVPPALSALIMRLLAKRPDERPRSAAEVRDLLAELS